MLSLRLELLRSSLLALLSELESLLAGALNDAYLLAIAQDARVNCVLDESSVRDWFRTIRDQVRLVVDAA